MSKAFRLFNKLLLCGIMICGIAAVVFIGAIEAGDEARTIRKFDCIVGLPLGAPLMNFPHD